MAGNLFFSSNKKTPHAKVPVVAHLRLSNPRGVSANGEFNVYPFFQVLLLFSGVFCFIWKQIVLHNIHFLKD